MLTKMQRKALDFLVARELTGVGPSFNEIAEHLGLSSLSGVQRLVLALEERGFIRRYPHRKRAIKVIRTGRKHVCQHCKGTGHVEHLHSDERVA